MDEIKVEENVTNIDVIDIIDSSDPTISYEEPERTERTDDSNESVTVSGSTIGTGNLISQIFKLIASFREKEYWELNNKEIKSLNITCPKIIPEIISKHKGLISCALFLLEIIMKRLKRERLEGQLEKPKEEILEEIKGLTGGRAG